MHDNLEYNFETQKLFINCFLGDDTIFTRCVGILNKEYFDERLQKTVDFILDYAEKYHAVPSQEILKAKTNIDIEPLKITLPEQQFILTEIEKFCRHKAVSNRIMEAPELIEKGKYADVEQGLKDALLISLNKDLGSDFFKDFQSSLEDMQTNNGTQSTGFKMVDKVLYGGFNRGELNVFIARSGGGKSLIMQNVALNWAMAGLNVVYFSFELSEALINKRLGSMLVGTPQKDIMKNLEETALKIGAKARKTKGSLVTKQMPQGGSTLELRAYLKEYEIKYGYVPDAIVVDYLDLMFPNNKKVDPSNLFIKDKFVSEELRGLAIEYKMLLVTASQVNREGMSELEFDFTHIAGGVSKINTSDNVIGILMTDAMRGRGEMQVQFLKTRSSGGVGMKGYLSFDPETLCISDKDEDASAAGTSIATTSSTDLINKLRRGAGQPEETQSQEKTDDTVAVKGKSLRDNFMKKK
jgi:hypothetical protein